MRGGDRILWGVATSSFQIEGSLDADGRGPSIWDDFPSEAGETGAVACDHYRRWREDIGLLADLGVDAYRFSIAWPRLLPDGGGRVELRGVDHYSRLIDALLERDIEPVVTLYHWDLPASLDWRDRDTAERFAELATACYEHYGDRVKWWLTINEPWIVGLLGFLHGLHAPGITGDVRAEVTVFHHLLVAHGLAAQAYDGDGKIGIALNLCPHYPASDDPEDIAVTAASDEYVNRWFLDPLYGRGYPAAMRERYESLVGPLELEDDLPLIATPTDYLGINYYAPRVMQAAPGDHPWPWRVIVPDEWPTTAGFTGGVVATEAGTPIFPSGLTDVLVGVHRDYGPPVMVTENGAVFPESPHDERRIDFIRGHVAALDESVAKGVDVLGYMHWSLMDNFEWRLGYAQRFGLVHVDYATQVRTIKDSGRFYADLIRSRRA